MNELYENFCKQVSWDENTDVDEVRLHLMEKYSKEQVGQLEGYASELLGRLESVGVGDAIASVAGYFGDDAWDCLCHIVSKGEEFVNSVLENVSVALEMYKNHDYHENFLYVFPSLTDFEMLDKDVHVRRALDGLKFLSETEQHIQSDDIPFARELMNKMIDLKYDSSIDYREVYNRTKDLGHHGYFANIWLDFYNYYVKVHPEIDIANN